MSIRYLVDENLRGTLAVALIRVATRYGLILDILQVGDTTAPGLGTLDPELLVWAEFNDRVLISKDRKTLAVHLAAHLAAGRHCPGILLVRDLALMEIAEHLVLLAFAGDPQELHDCIHFVP